MTTDSPMSPEAIYGPSVQRSWLYIEAKQLLMGKAGHLSPMYIARGEEFTTYTSAKSFTSPQETQMEAIADTRKWIDSR